MGKARMHAHVEAPIEVAFDYAADFRHPAEWNVMVIDMTGDAPLTKVGDHFTGTMKFLGRTYTGEGQVTEIERPKLLAFTSTSPQGGRQDWVARFTPVGSGTDLDTEIDYEVPLGLIGAIGDKLFMEKVVQRSLEQSRDNFVAIVEQRVLQPV
jgi:uncharacterized protein YndB with AHSA1/START domain